MNSILLGIGVAVVLFGAWIAYSYRKLQKSPPPADHPNVKTLNRQNFKQLAGKGLVLVDFWAPWCGPCKIIAPVLNEMADELNGKLRIGKVNVDLQSELAGKFKVRNIPTLVLLQNGKEVKRFVGAKTKRALLSEMSDFL